MGGKPRPKYINEAFDSALTAVQLCEWRILGLRFATRGVQERKRFMNPGSAADNDFQALYSALYADLNEAYRRLLMWAHMTPDARRTKKAAKMAYDHYLREGMEIMGYLHPSGMPPGRYLASDKDAFRAELDEAAERMGLDLPEEK